MAEFPCLPLWTDAYLGDTLHLTTEEHGAYLLLLMQAWRSPDCSLPDDDDLLARHAKLSPTRWKSAKPNVMAFWRHDSRRNRWVQKRLKKERHKATEKRAKARDSAASRWKSTKSEVANAVRSQCSPEPYPYEEPSGSSKRASAPKKPPGWISPKTHTDVAHDLIREIDEHERRRVEANNDPALETVRLLPAVRTG